ncbi:hypothetical protein B5V89_19705 [Heyndrickxia sporothermodurans]|uniref:hypothetical protein n=1 Tax=Heyndrickxia sporothermodurans TaxID=46224 RepID=UPI000D38F985|nr:hypothetical protein [Heyndrickxia sporothermodurans]PTY75794.1 hypothetical protein B5V89_19705 [Heyndrickxia sporothermodurans]
MKIVLTGNNNNYKNGYNGEYESVNINFVAIGDPAINLSGYVEVTKEQYDEARDSDDNLKKLVKQEIINKLQEEGAK